MTATARRKGNAFEREVVEVFRAAGFTQAQRALAGATDDRGDVAGLEGVVVEAKNHNRLELGDWMTETEREAANAGVDIPLLVVKRRSKPAARAYAVLPLEVAVELLAIRAGRRP